MSDKTAAIAEPVENTIHEERTEQQTEERTDQRTRAKRQPPYNVILWNDDDHTYHYVIDMLHAVFSYPPEKGFELAKEVDTRGKAIVMTTTLERAELKRDQIHAYGKDRDIRDCKGSMSATLEAAV